MTIEISVIEDPPAALIKAALEFDEGYPTIKEIIFGAGILNVVDKKEPISSGEKSAAIYVPKEKLIVIDLCRCVTDNKFSNMGVSTLPNVWLNMLFHFYHEIGHALQVERDSSLAEINELLPWFENEADEFAKEMSLEWCTTHPIPKLEEMGWVKERVKKVINNLYHSTIGGDVLDELEAAERGGVTPAKRFALLNELNADVLFETIDKKEVGVIIKGERYLTASDCLGSMITISSKKTAGAQNQKIDEKITEKDVMEAYNELLTLEGGF